MNKSWLDAGHSCFFQILEWVAWKLGKRVIKIDRTFSISLGELSERNKKNEQGQINPKRENEEVSPDFPEGEITGKIISYGHKTDKNPQAIL